jgi:hypothetical protein
MAHIFKWADIYRILKNQRSPQIEELGSAYVKEFVSMWGSLFLMLEYFVELQTRRVVDIFDAEDLRESSGKMISYMIQSLKILASLSGVVFRTMIEQILGGSREQETVDPGSGGADNNSAAGSE